MSEPAPRRRFNVRLAQRRTKVIVWTFIILIVAGTAAMLWNGYGRVGFWELLPLGVAILFAILAYRRAATARRR